jgi:hypothetical protein
MDIPQLTQKLSLPHLSDSEKAEVAEEIRHTLTRQLGNDDYCVVGEMTARGTAKLSLDDLKQKMAKKAAARGGDIILVYNEGIEERPFVYTVPGSSTTTYNGSANAYRCGNSVYATGQGTAYTTYTPPQTYSGVLHLPYAQAIALAYCPGFDEYSQRINRLMPDEMAQFAVRRSTMDLKHLSFVERNAKLKAVLDQIEQSHASQVSMANNASTSTSQPASASQ